MVSAKEWMEAHPEYPWMAECRNLAGPVPQGVHAVRGHQRPVTLLPAGAPGFAAFYDPVIVTKPENVWVHPTARIDSFVKLEGGEGLWIGPYVHVASFCHVGAGGGRVVLEEGCTLASHVVVCSGQSMGQYPSAADPQFQKRTWDTVVGHHTCIFAGCVIVASIAPEMRLAAGTTWRRQ